MTTGPGAEAPTLTDRYIHAATRSIRTAERAAVAAELRERIADATDARLAAGVSPDTVEASVLTELGDPERVAADYTGQALHLIGPRFYLTWRRLVKILLATVVPCVVFAMLLAGVIDRDPIGAVVWSAIAIPATVAIHLVFWTTFAFAMIERLESHAAGRGKPLRLKQLADIETAAQPWTIDQLVTVGPARTRLARSSFIALVAYELIFAALVVLQQFLVVLGGTPVPLVDPVHWSFLLPWLLCVAAVRLALTIVVYLRGRWQGWSASLYGIATLAFIVPVIWHWTAGTLVNPAFNAAAGIDADDEAVRVIGVVLGIGALIIAGSEMFGPIRAAWRGRAASVGTR